MKLCICIIENWVLVLQELLQRVHVLLRIVPSLRALYWSWLKAIYEAVTNGTLQQLKQTRTHKATILFNRDHNPATAPTWLQDFRSVIRYDPEHRHATRADVRCRRGTKGELYCQKKTKGRMNICTWPETRFKIQIWGHVSRRQVYSDCRYCREFIWFYPV